MKIIDIARNVLYAAAVGFMFYCGLQELKGHSFNVIDFVLTIFISGSVGVRLMRLFDEKAIEKLKELVNLDSKIIAEKETVLATFAKEYQEYKRLTNFEIDYLTRELAKHV